MALALDCENMVHIPTVAGYLSQMTGVLAGFALTAIIVLLTPTQIEERKSSDEYASDNGVLLLLVVAFVALVLSTLTYSVVGGERETNGRAATQEIIASVPFGLATLMMFQGIALLLQEGSIDRFSVFVARAMTVVVTPMMIMSYAAFEIQHTETIRIEEITGTCLREPVSPPSLVYVLTGVLAGTLALSLVPVLRFPIMMFWARKFRRAIPITVMVVSVTAAGAASSVASGAPDLLLPPSAVELYIIGLFVLLLALGLMVSFGYTDERGPDRTSAAGVEAAEPRSISE